MTIIEKTLNDSAVMRWSVLALVSFTMLCGYIFTDIMAPLKPVLERELGWSSTDYGVLSGAFGFLNVFMLMIIFGGMILDKMGIRFAGLTSCIIMIVGCAIKYMAIKGILPTDGYIFGLKSQVFLASAGFAIFGTGCEIINITVTKITAKWFKGKEMALAMGLQVSTARIGTIIALMFTLPVAEFFGEVKEGILDYDESAPLLISLILLCIALPAFFVYMFYDRKLDKQIADSTEGNPDEAFKFSDVFIVIRNRGFWLIAVICFFFYSAVFPFLKYASDLMINKYGVSESLAGVIPAILPMGTLLLTPLFGTLYDRKGHGATIMLIGSCILVGVHLLFSSALLNYWWFATILMFILGVAFSLVPSAMWPSVPKIIDDKRLGTAYALIFWLQNWGLMGGPILVGIVLDKYCRISSDTGIVSYNYTLPMLLFAAFGIVALIFSLVLKHEDKKRGYGLEKPNMVK